MKKLYVSVFLIATSVGVLSGCSTGFDEIKARMDAIRKQPRGRVEPPPEFTPLPSFTYAAHQLRSPFTPPETEMMIKVRQGDKPVMPDFSLPQEFLEKFNLEALRMRGTLQRPGSVLYGLIEDGEGGVQRVKIGNYVGKNHGRITEITQSQINLIEIVPDGRDGWVERPRSIVMADK